MFLSKPDEGATYSKGRSNDAHGKRYLATRIRRFDLLIQSEFVKTTKGYKCSGCS